MVGLLKERERERERECERERERDREREGKDKFQNHFPGLRRFCLERNDCGDIDRSRTHKIGRQKQEVNTWHLNLLAFLSPLSLSLSLFLSLSLSLSLALYHPSTTQTNIQIRRTVQLRSSAEQLPSRTSWTSRTARTAWR